MFNRPFFFSGNRPYVNPFVPSDLSNLIAWYKSDTGVTLSGSSVTGWADQSGNSRDLIPQYSPSYPTKVNNVLNGYPAIRGAATSVGLRTASAFPDHASTGITVFVVGMQPASEQTDGGHYHGFCGTGDPYNANYGWQIMRNFNFADYMIFQGAYQGQANKTSPELTDGTYYTIRFKVTPTGFIYAALNNGSEASGSSSVNTVPSSYLMVLDTYSGDHWSNKDIMEIAIFQRVLNSTEEGQMETYFKNKYNHY